MHWRTHVVDVCTMDSNVDGEALYELAEAGLGSTEGAIQNSHPLLDWDEYRSV
jgi:hypothetical protein